MKIIKKMIKLLLQRISKQEKSRLDRYREEFPVVLSTKETLDKVIKSGYSLVRFGDAEFDICNRENENDPYQRPSVELSRRLIEILSSREKNVIVCIPPFNHKYNNIKNYYGYLSFWEWYWLNKYESIHSYLKEEVYGNSFVSRDAVFYENDVSEIKKIWEGRKVVFVYSRSGRFNLKSEIFNNIDVFSEIDIPPVHAFDNYDNILQSCLTFTSEHLFLIAAGPTATVLAYDLSKKGYQALDIGHLPNCYDQFLGRIISPEALPMNKVSEETQSA